MEKTFVVTKQNFLKLLENISKTHNVVSPYGDDNYIFETFNGSFTFNKYRAVTSLRQFLLPSQQSLGVYFPESDSYKKPFCIVGVKACDLQSLKIQDYVFLEGEVDESYKYMRENNIIISSDCTAFKEVCFCLSLDIPPYPQDMFDLNISIVDDVFLVDIGSDKGRKIVDDNRSLFQMVRDDYLTEREANRSQIVDSLKESIKQHQLPPRGVLYELIKKGYDNEVWETEAQNCVECGACIMNCPTCHCFLLADSKKGNDYLRSRIWDGCQYKNFSRVAGGANPLKFRKERLRNKYIKKFEFFPDRIGVYACTGCGRCIESCIAKIDLREIFRILYGNKAKV